jgi:transcription elongation factor Elf1
MFHVKQTPFFSDKPCLSCGNEKFSMILESEDFFLSNDRFSIIKCTNCGLVRTFPLPDKESIKKYYQSDEYISHTGVNKGIINKLYLIIRKYTLIKKYHLIKKYSNGLKLLDYGAGSGHFI